MNVLWKEGDCTAKYISDVLKEEVGWNMNTTYTLIKRCIKKAPSNGRNRIFCDLAWNDCQVPLAPEEQAFVQTSIRLSCMENAKLVQSHYTGQPEEDPMIDERLLPKQTADGTACCDLYCQFFWHIADRDQLTVRQRDQAAGGLLAAVWNFCEETDLNEVPDLTKEEVVSLLGDLAREYSTDLITLSVREDGIGFETMDKRELRY